MEERSDEIIKEDVYEALMDNIWVDPSDIKVDVIYGYVYLRGKVQDRKQKLEAQNSAEHVLGVKGVINYLTLKQDLGLIGDMADKARMH